MYEGHVIGQTMHAEWIRLQNVALRIIAFCCSVQVTEYKIKERRGILDIFIGLCCLVVQ